MTESVSLELKNILTEIFTVFNDNSFYLAGGTNLALKYTSDFHEADLEKEAIAQIVDFELKTWKEVKDFVTQKVGLYLKEQNK